MRRAVTDPHFSPYFLYSLIYSAHYSFYFLSPVTPLFPLLSKIFMVSFNSPPSTYGGLFYYCYWYPLPFGRKGYLNKPEMQYLGLWGPHFRFWKNVGSSDQPSSAWGSILRLLLISLTIWPYRLLLQTGSAIFRILGASIRLCKIFMIAFNSPPSTYGGLFYDFYW